jgi:hypothetical protein
MHTIIRVNATAEIQGAAPFYGVETEYQQPASEGGGIKHRAPVRVRWWHLVGWGRDKVWCNGMVNCRLPRLVGFGGCQSLNLTLLQNSDPDAGPAAAAAAVVVP